MTYIYNIRTCLTKYLQSARPAKQKKTIFAVKKGEYIIRYYDREGPTNGHFRAL